MRAATLHILPIAYIQRKRMLPVPGKVSARKGVKVMATDTVAEAVLAPEHSLLDIVHGLGLSEAEADQQIARQPGTEVTTGDVLAGPVGLARRVVRATRPGKVVLAGGGHVLLELKAQPFALAAGLSGVVTELYPEWGVTIETVGGLVQGVWGNGRLGMGQLTVVAKAPDEELIPAKLDMSMRLSVVLGGYCGNVETLRVAEELPLRGLILSSMSATLVPTALKMHCPVILLDGFGRIPMNETAYRLLSTSDRNEATVNAEPWDRFSGKRPEVILNVPEGSRPGESMEADEFNPGDIVRVVRPPYHGMIGELSAMAGMVSLPNGLLSSSAEVTFDNGDIAVLPLTNLEVLK